ncbi:MAG TPA: M48 family metalloprotease [Thermoanaerobaculia bacterium]|jgi:Zn-dependent protease with chaperone function|nr:M48 family metalloprotease [Thermoanaerobaculia bacterium]
MTDETFKTLVGRLERTAARHPALYKLRVLLLALLGYGYILGVLAGTVALVVLVLVYGRLNAVAIKIEIFLVVFAGLILRALWVRLPPPEGLPIERQGAEALFAEIDRLQKALRTPPVHQVLLTSDFNAAMSQVPRLGVLGWQKNYLTLGLPLMQAFSPAGFRAVLAHELGHLSGAHGRFGAWIYRVRRTWEQVLEQLEQHAHRGAVVFKRFFQWYAPYFSACSFVLARAHEYEADRLAAQAEGKRTAAQTLVDVAMAGDFLARDFWPSVFQRAISQPRPGNAFQELGRAVGGGAWRETARERLERVLKEDTEVQDSHPCLRDRIAALGEEPALPEPLTGESAADHYFGPALPELIERLEREWSAAIAPAWQQRYQEAQQQRGWLAALEEKSQGEPLGAGETLERALLTESLSGEEAALPLYRAVLEIEPENAAASFHLGRLLLDREDPVGVERIEAAMARDEDFTLPGLQRLAGFWHSRGEEDRARACWERAQSVVFRLQEGQRERDVLRSSDSLLEHGLPAEAVSDLADQLRRVPEVAAAYLARKETRLSPEQPLYVLAVQYKAAFFRTKAYHVRLNQSLANTLQFPGETFVASLALLAGPMRRRIRALPGSRIL